MVKKDSLQIQKLKKESRKYSIKEGIFSSARVSFGDRYISPFAIAINTSNSLIIMLSSIASILGPFSQLIGSKLIEKTTRKKIVLKSVFLESLMWLPLITIAILFYNGILTQILPLILLISFSLFIIFSNISYPAWFSWLGDIVNENKRGKWFAKRTLIMSFVTIILAISASFLLDYFKKINLIMIGFIILFSLALISRIICWKIFKKQYEPKIELKEGYYFSFADFILKSTKNNFGRFTIFRSVLGFATAISSPLIVIYLLKYLQFSYTSYVVITLAGTLFSLLVLKLWGKFADKYGNYRVLRITSIAIPIIPILWILNHSLIYLILVPSFIGGTAWAGFNISARNFIYDNISTQKRGLAVSYYNILIGIGVFFGAGLSAILIKFLTISFIEPLFFIFFLGSIIRMITVLFLLPQIKEIRKTKKFKGSETFKHIFLKEAKPTLIEEMHEIISIKDYLNKK